MVAIKDSLRFQPLLVAGFITEPVCTLDRLELTENPWSMDSPKLVAKTTLLGQIYGIGGHRTIFRLPCFEEEV